MAVISYLIVAISGFIFVNSQRGDSCITPNKENGSCGPLNLCEFYDAVKAKDKNAIKLAIESQCGYDTEPLICCQSTKVKQTDDYLDSLFAKDFTTTTTTTTPSPEQQVYKAILENFEIKGLSDRTVCGFEVSSDRIKGGIYAKPGESPWVAALEYKSNLTGEIVGIICGGSLINKRYVLTAAHCLTNKEFKLVNVRLGELDTKNDPDCYNENICADPVVTVKIEKTFIHEYYHPRTKNSDVALLRLERDVNFTDYIRPICLPSPYIPPPVDGTLMRVTGWGATEVGELSSIKLRVDVPVRPNSVCNDQLKLAYESKRVVENQLCVGGEPGKDSCQGDSGGPLMKAYRDKVSGRTQWYQEGVVSYGIGCGAQGRPAIYTRLSSFVTWIANKIAES